VEKHFAHWLSSWTVGLKWIRESSGLLNAQPHFGALFRVRRLLSIWVRWVKLSGKNFSRANQICTRSCILFNRSISDGSDFKYPIIYSDANFKIWSYNEYSYSVLSDPLILHTIPTRNDKRIFSAKNTSGIPAPCDILCIISLMNK